MKSTLRQSLQSTSKLTVIVLRRLPAENQIAIMISARHPRIILVARHRPTACEWLRWRHDRNTSQGARVQLQQIRPNDYFSPVLGRPLRRRFDRLGRGFLRRAISNCELSPSSRSSANAQQTVAR